MKLKRNLPIGSTHKMWGYTEIKTESGWIREHIHVLETYLGRKLEKGEVTHHCNEIKTDNNIENLELMLNWAHSSMHQTGVKASKSAKLKMSESKKNMSALTRYKMSIAKRHNKHPKRKLGQDDADFIRTQYYYGGISQRKAGSMVGVSRDIVKLIVGTKTYKRGLSS